MGAVLTLSLVRKPEISNRHLWSFQSPFHIHSENARHSDTNIRQWVLNNHQDRPTQACSIKYLIILINSTYYVRDVYGTGTS